MNIDKAIITSKFNQIVLFCQRHAIVLGFSIFAILYGYIIVQASTASTNEPDPDVVSRQIQAVPHPKIDKETAKKIESLEDQNINVQAIFKDARENPFSE